MAKAAGSVNTLQEHASRATAPLDGLRQGLTNVAATAAGFVIGGSLLNLPAALSAAGQAAADDAQSQTLLQTALRNTGQYSEAAVKQLEAQASAGIALGFADEQVRQSLGLLMAQTGSAEEAQKRLALAMDLARGTGMDLYTASKLLGKASDENANVLARYGIVMQKGADDTALFGAVQEKFGGQAKAFADSSAGAWAQFQLQMDEVRESLGYALLPLMGSLANLANTTLVPAFQNGVAPALARVGSAVAGLTTSLQTGMSWLNQHKEAQLALSMISGGLVGALLLIPAAMNAITLATTAWSAAQAILNGALLANPIGLIVTALAALAAGLIYVYTHSETFRNMVNSAFAGLAGAGVIVGALAKQMAELGKAVLQHGDQIKVALLALLGPIGWLGAAWMTNFGGIRDITGQVVSWIGSRLADLVNFMATIGRALGMPVDDWLRALNEMRTGATAALSGVGQVFSNAGNTIGSIMGEVSDAVSEASDSMSGGLATASSAVTTSFKGFVAASILAYSAADELAFKLQGLNTTLSDLQGDSSNAQKQLNALKAAVEAGMPITDEARDLQHRLSEEIKQNTIAAGENVLAQERARKELELHGGQAAAYANDLDQLRRKGQDAAVGMGTAEASIAAAGKAADEARTAIDTLASSTDTAKTSVSSMNQAVGTSIDDLKRTLQTIPADVSAIQTDAQNAGANVGNAIGQGMVTGLETERAAVVAEAMSIVQDAQRRSRAAQAASAGPQLSNATFTLPRTTGTLSQSTANQLLVNLGWTPEQIAAACGPLAAAAVAEGLGQRVNWGTLLQDAARAGWDTSIGMHGSGAFSRLLAQWVPNEVYTGLEQGRAAAVDALNAGMPVVIDTVRHYFEAISYNASTGRFNVGNSGLAMGGATQMTLDEMIRLGGGLQSIIVPSARQAMAALTDLSGNLYDNTDALKAYITQAAAMRGIDPAVALRVASAETANFTKFIGDAGSSFGPFQLHVRGVSDDIAGLGDEFQQLTGESARNPATWGKQIDYALTYAAQHGWGAFHAAAVVGISDWDGIGEAMQTFATVNIPTAIRSLSEIDLSQVTVGMSQGAADSLKRMRDRMVADSDAAYQQQQALAKANADYEKAVANENFTYQGDLAKAFTDADKAQIEARHAERLADLARGLDEQKTALDAQFAQQQADSDRRRAQQQDDLIFTAGIDYVGVVDKQLRDVQDKLLQIDSETSDALARNSQKAIDNIIKITQDAQAQLDQLGGSLANPQSYDARLRMVQERVTAEKAVLQMEWADQEANDRHQRDLDKALAEYRKAVSDETFNYERDMQRATTAAQRASINERHADRLADLQRNLSDQQTSLNAQFAQAKKDTDAQRLLQADHAKQLRDIDAQLTEFKQGEIVSRRDAEIKAAQDAAARNFETISNEADKERRKLLETARAKLADARQEFLDKLPELTSEQQAVIDGFLENIDKTISDTLGSIPSELDSSLKQSTDAISGYVIDINGELQKIERDITVSVQTVYSSSGPGGGGAPSAWQPTNPSGSQGSIGSTGVGTVNANWDLATQAGRDLARQAFGSNYVVTDTGILNKSTQKVIYGYAEGGIVPGPVGMPQIALVHGGERVLPGPQASTGSTNTTNVYLTVNGTVVTPDELVDAIHSGLLKKQRRNGSLGW